MRTKSLWLVGLLGSIVLLSAACTRKFDPQTACGFVQNSDLQRVSWNAQTPIHIYVHKSFPLDKYPDMEKVIRESAQAWNQVVGREVIRIEAFNVGGSDVPQKDGYSMLYWLNTWEPNRSTEQARTTIFWSGSQIYETDIRVNAQDHTYYVGSDASFTGVDLKSLLIHEFGHALGLAHNNAVGSVMAVTLDNGYDRRKIKQPDIADVRCEY